MILMIVLICWYSDGLKFPSLEKCDPVKGENLNGFRWNIMDSDGCRWIQMDSKGWNVVD